MKALAERVTLAVGVLGLVAFAIGLARSSEAVVAAGAVGFAYKYGMPAVGTVAVLATGLAREAWRWLVAVWVMTGVALVLEPPRIESWQLHHFGKYQTVGILVSAFTLCGLIAVAYLRHKETHKECPDCAETVLAKARVCRYCGFRWEAYPLAGR